MSNETRQSPDWPRSPKRLSLRFGGGNELHEGPRRWALRPRSRPNQDGSRRITIEARSDTETFIVDLNAGEAAELMSGLGSALEQAAKDEVLLAGDRQRPHTIQKAQNLALPSAGVADQLPKS